MKCGLCGEETGRPKKRFCGHYTIFESCAYKNNLQKNKERKSGQKALHSRRDGTVKRRKAKEKALQDNDYCIAAKDSGYF